MGQCSQPEFFPHTSTPESWKKKRTHSHTHSPRFRTIVNRWLSNRSMRFFTTTTSSHAHHSYSCHINCGSVGWVISSLLRSICVVSCCCCCCCCVYCFRMAAARQPVRLPFFLLFIHNTIPQRWQFFHSIQCVLYAHTHTRAPKHIKSAIGTLRLTGLSLSLPCAQQTCIYSCIRRACCKYCCSCTLYAIWFPWAQSTMAKLELFIGRISAWLESECIVSVACFYVLALFLVPSVFRSFGNCLFIWLVCARIRLAMRTNVCIWI